MILSFALTEKIFCERDIKKFAKRLRRLVYPYVGWAVIYWSMRQFWAIITHSKTRCGMKELGWQLLAGSTVCPPFWYLFDLIIISLIYFLIFCFLPTHIAKMLPFILGIIALFLQLSGWNYWLFGTIRYELKYSLGRLAEMLPYAAIGFYGVHLGIYNKIQKHKIKVLCAVLVIGVTVRWQICDKDLCVKQEGFGYEGIDLILRATLLVILFAIWTGKNMPQLLKKGVYWLSKYTFGIFCLHILVGSFYNSIMTKMGYSGNEFVGCVVIWALCYVVSFCITKVPLINARFLVE